MVIGAHIWGEDIEQSLLLFALKKTAALQPTQKFIFFSNLPLANLSQNCYQVNINPRPTNKVLLYFWYNYKLPKLILKYSISTFISNSGMLASDALVKQYLFLETKDLLNDGNSIFKKRLANAIALAQKIFVVDDVIGETVNKHFPTNKDKVQTLHFGLIEANKIFSWDDIEGIRNKYTAGFDYYLFRVDATSKANIITVLKSFSQLKKWQKTSLKLVLLFENDIDEKLLPDFKNYKYRNEVVLIKETDQNLLLLIAAAFSYINFSDHKNRNLVYNALQYNVPVIAADTETNNLLFKSTVAYAAASVEGLALQLQLIYKDEVLRKQLLQKATIYLTQFDSEKASQKFGEIISN